MKGWKLMETQCRKENAGLVRESIDPQPQKLRVSRTEEA